MVFSELIEVFVQTYHAVSSGGKKRKKNFFRSSCKEERSITSVCVDVALSGVIRNNYVADTKLRALRNLSFWYVAVTSNLRGFGT